jgi:hypothetical protein
MSDLREALTNALERSGKIERLQKAKKLQEDVEALYASPEEAPEQLKEDIAALCDQSDYEDAQARLERL